MIEELRSLLNPIPEPSSVGILQRDLLRRIPLKEYMDLAWNPDKFLKMCEECPRYNKSWACPPFDYDCKKILDGYDEILLVATRIEPISKGLPDSMAREVIRPARSRLERALLGFEKGKAERRAFGFAGGCLCCKDDSCTRPGGLPCRHPEIARPSLESFGFDISRTLDDIFEEKIEWCSDGRLPSFLTLVSGVLVGARAKQI